MDPNKRHLTRHYGPPTLYPPRDDVYDASRMPYQNPNMTVGTRTQTGSSKTQDSDIMDGSPQNKDPKIKRSYRPDGWTRRSPGKAPKNDPKREKKTYILREALSRMIAPPTDNKEGHNQEMRTEEMIRFQNSKLERGTDQTRSLDPKFDGLRQIPSEVTESKRTGQESPSESLGIGGTWFDFGRSGLPHRPDNESDSISISGAVDPSTLSSGLPISRAQEGPFRDVQSPEGIDLSKLLDTIKDALDTDPSASYLTKLKQPKSVETVEIALEHLGSSYKRAQQLLKENDLALSTLQKEKSTAETLNSQCATDLRETRAKYDRLKEENTKWELAFKGKETETRDLEKRLASRNSELAKLNGQLQQHAQNAQTKSLEVERLKSDLKLAGAHHQNNIENLRKEHEQNIKEQQNIHDSLLASAATDNERRLARREKELHNKIAELEGLIQELTGELLKRDHHNSLKDRDISRKFSHLVDKIDDLARIEWSDRLVKNWPMSSQLLRNATNGREAKQYKLQDLIWRVLYHYIFCSPFRVFGDEGIEMEKKWISSSDTRIASINNGRFIYPNASNQTEQWRYDKIESCIESLNHQVDELDPKFKLQQSHRECLSRIEQEIYHVITSVASQDYVSARSATCREIAEEAAKMWLEFGKERYRLIMAMPLEIEEGHVADRNATELIVQPELRRFGNSRGDDLRREQLVGESFKTYTIRRR